jgi:hypothetical protein
MKPFVTFQNKSGKKRKNLRNNEHASRNLQSVATVAGFKVRVPEKL